MSAREGPLETTSAASRHTDRLAELYERFQPRARRIAYLLTGDRELAEDLAQEAFVKVAGRLTWIRNPDAFEAYLRRTVVNLCRGHWRRTRTERSYLRSEGPRAIEPSADVSGEVDARDQLWRALQGLPHRQRAALVLRFYEDLSEQAVADALGCPAGTVKSLVSRGLKALREVMGDNDVT